MQFWLSQTSKREWTFGERQIAIAIVLGMLMGTAMGATPHLISQKGREFQPGEIAIKRGEALQFINDDGDLLHHTYLKSDTFSFDSGDQKPGSKFEVAFTVSGQFTIRCAIHPKMKLLVVVD